VTQRSFKRLHTRDISFHLLFEILQGRVGWNTIFCFKERIEKKRRRRELAAVRGEGLRIHISFAKLRRFQSRRNNFITVEKAETTLLLVLLTTDEGTYLNITAT
jgi:hypothetical protein